MGCYEEERGGREVARSTEWVYSSIHIARNGDVIFGRSKALRQTAARGRSDSALHALPRRGREGGGGRGVRWLAVYGGWRLQIHTGKLPGAAAGPHPTLLGWHMRAGCRAHQKRQHKPAL
jgi:hypothetical protein